METVFRDFQNRQRPFVQPIRLQTEQTIDAGKAVFIG